MTYGAGSRSRCLAVALVATAGAAGAARVAVVLMTGGPGAPPGDTTGASDASDAVTRVCTLALLAALAWGWTAVLAGVAEAWPGAPRNGSAAEPTTRLRRWVLAACGVALTGALATVPAHADPRAPHPGPRLSGLPMPERALGPAHARHLTASVVVRPGDSLWSLAGTELGSSDRWPAIYRLNEGVIGPDPDLIHPGTRLLLPRRPR